MIEKLATDCVCDTTDSKLILPSCPSIHDPDGETNSITVESGNPVDEI